MKQKPTTKFERVAAQGTGKRTWPEVWSFLRSNKRWWMAPIIVVLLLFGLLIFLSGTAAAPFIYTLF